MPFVHLSFIVDDVGMWVYLEPSASATIKVEYHEISLYSVHVRDAHSARRVLNAASAQIDIALQPLRCTRVVSAAAWQLKCFPPVCEEQVSLNAARSQHVTSSECYAVVALCQAVLAREMLSAPLARAQHVLRTAKRRDDWARAASELLCDWLCFHGVCWVDARTWLNECA